MTTSITVNTNVVHAFFFFFSFSRPIHHTRCKGCESEQFKMLIITLSLSHSMNKESDTFHAWIIFFFSRKDLHELK